MVFKVSIKRFGNNIIMIFVTVFNKITLTGKLILNHNIDLPKICVSNNKITLYFNILLRYKSLHKTYN